MAPTVTVPVKLELDNAVVLRPGDKLVLGYSQFVNEAEADELKARLAVKLPGVEVVIISAITAMTVYQANEVRAMTDAERRKQDRIDGR